MQIRILWFLFWLTHRTLAHGIDDGFLQLSQQEGGWVGIWRAPVAVFAGCDSNRDGQIGRDELSNGWDTLTAGKILLLDANGQSIAPALNQGEVIQSPSQLTIPVRFECPPSPTLGVEYRLYLPSATDQQCLAILTNHLGENKTLLLKPSNPRQSLSWKEGPKPETTFISFFELGVKHIWTGYDHLLFLLTLVVTGGSLLRWFQVITAFSVAHSISLALAVFGVVHLSADIVEPMIALSITIAALVAWRGLAAQKMNGGWQLAFSFGLIHGLGFAGVLAELQLSGRQALLPLVSFNLGVEVGQLCVAAALMPIIFRLCRDQTGTRVRQGMTILAGLMGLYWFTTRL
ncbi:HupE/UreJ family protein [bacterium]|nr:HupE/UreJ family protein [bacterium]